MLVCGGNLTCRSMVKTLSTVSV